MIKQIRWNLDNGFTNAIIEIDGETYRFSFPGNWSEKIAYEVLIDYLGTRCRVPCGEHTIKFEVGSFYWNETYIMVSK